MTQESAPGQVPVTIEMWADLGCPWCYLGKHRLHRAIAARPDADLFRVAIRSFELHPEFPREPEPLRIALARIYGDDAAGVLEAEQRFQELARSEGLEFALDRLSANTFDVHRLTQFATEHGIGLALFSEIQDRYFVGDLNPFDDDALVSVAEGLGLPGARAREVLVGDEYAAAVRSDTEEGRALGARGVPFIVFGRRLTVSGVPSSERYARALDEVVAAGTSEATA